ncbi:MAG: small subunit ribosomal protein S3 [Alphaproteobacteria bacterium]|jgi:small subunit ribosomal protein S3
MGQKSNPIILRVGINRSWNSVWYANRREFASYLKQDYLVKKFIASHFQRQLIERVYIERLHKKCIVNIFTPRPGVIIGRKGNDIEQLRKKLSDIIQDEIVVNISEVKKPEVSAFLIAENIAVQLERRVSYKKAMKRAIQSAMRAGAQGIKIACAGRLGGAEIARDEYYKEGRIPLHTLRSNIDFGVSEAYTAYGICGIKVWVYKGDIFQ